MTAIVGVPEPADIGADADQPVRRVREEVRDGALLMAFSAAVSCAAAAALVLASRVLG